MKKTTYLMELNSNNDDYIYFDDEYGINDQLFNIVSLTINKTKIKLKFKEKLENKKIFLIFENINFQEINIELIAEGDSFSAQISKDLFNIFCKYRDKMIKFKIQSEVNNDDKGF